MVHLTVNKLVCLASVKFAVVFCTSWAPFKSKKLPNTELVEVKIVFDCDFIQRR